jgi:hypothetical protein
MPEKRPVVFVYVQPSMLYSILPPVGAVTVIVPVATVHVGCVTGAVGAGGVMGWALTVPVAAAEIQPTLFLALTLYVPVATPVKRPVVLV